jgi:GNAT superfamily N-acetyltransferase
MHLHSVRFRPGERSDAIAIAALSVQVFLDTYATEGVRTDLAREAFREYSEAAFLSRLCEPNRRFVLAEAQEAALVGFAELESGQQAARSDHDGWELVRLYVQPRWQRSGVGSSLAAGGRHRARGWRASAVAVGLGGQRPCARLLCRNGLR